MMAMMRKTLLYAMLLVTSISAGAAEMRRYVVTGGGTQLVETDGDRVVVQLDTRGAKLRSETRLDERGLPLFVAVKGTSFQSTVLDEAFERGSANGFYISLAQSAEERALVARALLRAPERRLPLLPHGSARIERVLERTFGEERATLYAIFGLIHGPAYVWLDDANQLFAAHDWYGTTIRSDAQRHAAAADAAQQKAAQKWRQDVVARLTKKHAVFAITNASLFDPESGRVTPSTTILVEGNHIVRVGTTVAIPEGAERIDASGRVVLPGLWDMHQHVRGDDLPFHLAAGVTSVRDLTGRPTESGGLRDEIEKGLRIGPRVLTSQLLSDPSSTLEQARKDIDACVQVRCDQVKLYSGFPQRLIRKVAEYVHAKGLRLSGHIPAGTIASKAVADGLDEIHHINQMMLNFMPDVKNTNSPLRFTAFGERGGGIDVRSEEVRAFIAQLRERGTVVDPTVGVFELMFATPRGEVAPVMEKARAHMPVQLFQVAKDYRVVPISATESPHYKAAYARGLELVAAMHKAGVRIVAGTDGEPAGALHRELELYVEAGLSPVDALRSATLVPAQVMKRDKELGRVAAGMLADFVIVDGDPTKNISDVRRVVTVVKDGAIYAAAAIDGEMGVGE
jgi:imidazolonepropionase-like amidohydrolase